MANRLRHLKLEMAVQGILGAFWMLIWLFLLITVALTVAIFAAVLYTVTYILVPCCPALKELVDILHKGVLLPYYCSDNMVHRRNLDEAFNFMGRGNARGPPWTDTAGN